MTESYAPIAAALAIRRRLLISGHGTYLTLPLEQGLAPATRLAYRRAARILCVSHYTRDRLLAQLPGLRSCVVIPNGVAARFLTQPDSAPPREPLLLSVGPIKPRKGHHLTIEAFAAATVDHDRWRLVIIGLDTDADYRARLRSLAREHRVAQRVEICSPVSDDELIAWYRRASLFVLPARNVDHTFEGFGLVYLEANACGLPVIGSRDCGAEEAIRDGETGLLVGQDDVGELTAAIASLITDPDRCQAMGERGRAWAAEHTWERVAKQVLTASRS